MSRIDFGRIWSRGQRLRRKTRQNHRARRLRLESLEDRRVLSLVGIQPLINFPIVDYNVSGEINYDAGTEQFLLDADPKTFAQSFFDISLFTGNVDFVIDIRVDNSGNLIGGSPGDDLTILGDIDVDNDTVIDFSGTLLTGEVTEFGFQDGPQAEQYDFRFTLTGGQMASFYAGSDLGVVTTSEVIPDRLDEEFTGSFAENFAGGAKGSLGAIEPNVPELAALGDFVWEDLNGDGVQDPNEPGVGGVTVELLDSTMSPIESTTTAGDGSYAFVDLTPGDYFVQFSAPAGFEFTIQDAGADNVDSDADPVNGKSAIVNLSPGETDNTIDAGLVSPAIDIQKATNGQDADDPSGPDVPQIAPGDTVTWSYLVTNTGSRPLAFDEVVIVDDNGTPGDGSDDFGTGSTNSAGTTITFDSGSDVGSDLILSPGEIWTYTASAVAQDVSSPGTPVVVDFDADGLGAPLAAGTIVDDEYANFGLAITSQNPALHPAMIFDSANPTGGDNDLATPGWGVGNDTPLGNVLIVSEDGNQNDPDDDAGGGTLTFDFDQPVTVDTISLLDIDTNESGGTIVSVMQSSGTTSISIPALGNNSFQTVDINLDDVISIDVNFVSSGAVSELVYHLPEAGFYKNTAVVTAPGSTDMDMSSYVNKPVIDIEKLVKVVQESPAGGEGLTPGYWKQHHHFDDWFDFQPGDHYVDVFMLDPGDEPGDLTLIEALKRGGGGNKALGRHAVAAILNAAHPNIDYDLTFTEIKAAVQDAYAADDFESLKDELDELNNQGANLKTSSPSGTVVTMTPLVDADEPTGPVAELGDVVMFEYRVSGDSLFDVVEVIDDNGTPDDPADDFHPEFAGGDTDGDGLLDPNETWIYTASIVADEFGQFMNLGQVTASPVDDNGDPTGADVADEDPAHYLVGEPTDGEATIQGIVWEDANNNGVVDFDENAIAGAIIELTGTDASGDSVHRIAVTDMDGAYFFDGLAPSDADGYMLTQTQPLGYDDGMDVLGEVNGVATGIVDGNDKFSGIVVKAGDQGEDYNFGERSDPDAEFVSKGQTATIGFWKNRKGQRLIKSVNEGLGDWLATNFPNLYGHLAGASNAEVAKFYKIVFKMKRKRRMPGPAKLDPQALAVALAMYVTNEGLAGTAAQSYGFVTSSNGLGGSMFDIDLELRTGSSERLFGAGTSSIQTVFSIFDQVDEKSHAGVLFDSDGDGKIDRSERFLRRLANRLFAAINEAGDIR